MYSFLKIAPVLLLALLLQSCLKDNIHTTLVAFEPVFAAKTTVHQNIKSAAATPLVKPGKIYVYGDYLLVNEINKGVHIINNSNPANPVNIAFIQIPGNLDIAVKNNLMYADLFTDMLVIDISNPLQAQLKKVVEHVFPERYDFGYGQHVNEYVVDWIRHESTTEEELGEMKANIDRGIFVLQSVFSSNSSAASNPVGIGGSMARFTIVDQFLYAVNRSSLLAFNISNGQEPVLAQTNQVAWNIETIYPFKDKLFIGGQTGMYMFSLLDPAAPAFLGQFTHACFNDPVVANDDYAFVTLRATDNASACWGPPSDQRNQLDVVDVRNILQPSLVKIYDMVEPQGLSIQGQHLFLCDGKGGFKIYDFTNVENLRLLKTFSNIAPTDVITYNNIALVVAAQGIFQYDYSDIQQTHLISSIPVQQ